MVARRTFSNILQGQNSRFTGSTPLRSPASAKISFLLLEHFSMLAFTQAYDTLVTANLIQPGAFTPATCTLDGQPLVSDLGILICPDGALTESLATGVDLFVICGGLRSELKAHPLLSQALIAAGKKGVALGGLWNGAWFLGQAGLLEGYRCAVHPEHRGAVAEIARHSQVSSESFIADRDRLTAASPSGAFNLMLEWITRLEGAQVSSGIVDILAFEASRYRRTLPAPQENISEPLREAINLMNSNLEEPLNQDQLASYVGRSKRQIGRLFQLQLGTTPVRYYLELRITESRRLLQYSDLPILDVAVACGFVSASHFSKCYASFYGYSPSKEKRHGFVKATAANRKH